MSRFNAPSSQIKTFVQNSQLIVAAIDTELVMMDASQGAYFGLDEIGTAVWNILAKPHTVAELCAELMAAYEVDPATCEKDVVQLLNDMMAHNLVLVAD